MAAKIKRAYFCKECGYESPKWLGRCPACGEWNTFAEHVAAKEPSTAAMRLPGMPRAEAQRVKEIRERDIERIDTGIGELNRVLGGGLVPGSLILLGGEPGIGKSTLSLQMALCDNRLRTLYVSGEESAEQIKMRATRLGIANEECIVYPETQLENIIAQIDESRPQVVVIDSIQTMYTETVESSAGSVTQIRECAAALLRCAKTSGVAIFVIGHITKDGVIAGPKILEHIVDVVLQFEGDANNTYRILRGIKNRFGATYEIGVFDMREEGCGRSTTLGDTALALRRAAERNIGRCGRRRHTPLPGSRCRLWSAARLTERRSARPRASTRNVSTCCSPYWKRGSA